MFESCSRVSPDTQIEHVMPANTVAGLDMLQERREDGKEMIGIIKSSRGNPDPPEVRVPALSSSSDWLRMQRESQSRSARRPMV